MPRNIFKFVFIIAEICGRSAVVKNVRHRKKYAFNEIIENYP